MNKAKKITSARLFLPIVCLVAVLLLNVIKTPDFFNVSIQNGVLYGYIIDVINRASELVILAVGMTLCNSGFRRTGHQRRCNYGSGSGCMLSGTFRRRSFRYEYANPLILCSCGSTSCICSLRSV